MNNSNKHIDFSARNPNPSTNPMFSQRWSPRAFKKTQISTEMRETIFDAARWATSAYNEQPWRIFVNKDESDFDKFWNLLVDANKAWAKNATLIGFMVAKNKFSHNGKDNPYSTFDCGFAWGNIALQTRELGLYAHGMAGIKHDEVHKVFNIPKDEYKVVMGFVIGAIEDAQNIPDFPSWALEHEKPSPRKELTEIYFPGGTQL